ncbi:MAG TPA: crosslink repair DNA glycosylase YcaQ family protein [Candidatus Limnocylindria bacterium]|nr:crosslink repair DNA glycosylase YcaQ family protein [Candidatus Limnocylindria bacterium]
MGRRVVPARRTVRARAPGERRHASVREEAIPLTELRARRLADCRLTPDRKLRTLDDALGFLADRYLLTLTQDCSLPSLFAATHEEAYDATQKGFAAWPKTKWSWGGEIAQKENVFETKLHRGKTLFLSPEGARAADPLCRAALALADAGEDDSARLARHLKAAGPSTVEDLKRELGLEAGALRRIREGLEREGALVSHGISVEDSKGGHRHSSLLSRWDQVWRKPWKATEEVALDELVVLGVRAAVVTHEDEVRTWFTWPVSRPQINALVASGRLARPASGWLSLP